MADGVKPKIILGLPTLGHPSDKFIDAFVQLIQCGLLEYYCKISGGLLPEVRNTIIQKIYARTPDFTHILFVDDDMDSFNAEGIMALIEADVPIISAFMMRRGLPYKIVSSFDKYKDEEIIQFVQEGKIIETPHVGMGFTLIKREVFDETREHNPYKPLWYTTDRSSRDGFDLEVVEFVRDKLNWLANGKDGSEFTKILESTLYEAVSLGQNSHIGAPYIGEDVAFCHKATKFGFKSYVHCGVLVGHVGEFSFDFRNLFKNDARR